MSKLGNENDKKYSDAAESFEMHSIQNLNFSRKDSALNMYIEVRSSFLKLQGKLFKLGGKSVQLQLFR